MRFLFVKLAHPAYNAHISKLFVTPPDGAYVAVSDVRRNI